MRGSRRAEVGGQMSEGGRTSFTLYASVATESRTRNLTRTARHVVPTFTVRTDGGAIQIGG